MDEAPDLRDPDTWRRLIDALDRASLLVVIEHRMSPFLRARCSAEDILQDTLIEAWTSREKLEWRGMRSFRSWMLAIVDHRVLNVTAHLSTLSHGGGHTELSLAGLGAGDSSTSTPYAAWEAGSTTPSRVASYREQAQLMLRLLAELPDDLREVFRLRHFEGLELADIGQRLGLGVSAVRHRFRKASHLYLSRLQAASGSSCMPRKPDCATLEAGDPST